MVTRKKRMTICIAITIIILVVITIAITLLYFNTDILKSNQTLFLKYFGQNTQNIIDIKEIFEEDTEYEKMLENNKYIEEIEMKVNYTEDYGTTSENTSNIINNLKLKIEGQVDNINKYNYKDIKLLKEDEQILELEYVQSNDIYGIRFSDLFKQYVLVENKNLKELFEKLGYSEQEIENLPNSINIEQGDITDIIKFSAEEIEKLKEKYISSIKENLSKENFIKASNQVISINKKDMNVNAYTLKLTKEQLNNIYINVLENFKNEEIVLEKINNIQDIINKTVINFSETTNLKDKFIKEIENAIQEINRNNIGTEETKIIVYENQGKTIRTTLQGVDYQINLDYIKTEQENFVEINFSESANEVQKISINKNDKKINLNVEKNKSDNPITISIEEDSNIKNKNCKKNINIKYEDETNKLESNIIINTNIVEEFENLIVLDNENSIKLNELSEEQLNTILNRISEEVVKKIDDVAQEIKIEDLQQILTNINILNDAHILQREGVSETEKNRFNSKFEISQGENIESEDMLQIFEVIKENISDLQVISNKELKIEISRENKNEEFIKALENFIKSNDNRKYNVEVEYDVENGLVKYVVLTIVEE